MVVITLTSCPTALRGDLTKWLQEVNTGVYVGRVSSRVRDKLWKRISENSSTGKATMVYSANNEQGMKFRIHNSSWEPVDFDGLTLLMRPSQARSQSETAPKKGFSNAARIQKAKQIQRLKADKKLLPRTYVVIDLETTGLSAADHDIIEIGAVRVRDMVLGDSFQALIKPRGKIPPAIVALTGITDLLLEREGKALVDVLSGFIEFISDLPVVTHNADFDYAFLRKACKSCNLPLFSNRCINTLPIARKMVDGVHNYKLETLLNYFGVEQTTKHRALEDCLAANELYAKLIEIERRG